MGISGNLKTMQLAELLQWLSMGQKSGTLKIEKGARSTVIKRIFFEDGVIISSASTDPGEYLGRFLVSHGYLAEDAVNEAVARQKEEKQLLGKILVNMGLVEEDDLHQMLRLKAEESIYDIFTWDEGAFEFFDGDLPSETMVPMQMDVQWIVLEGTRRTDEWKRIQGVIPSPLCVPVLVTDLGQLELDDFERSLLEWVDDDRTVEEISQGAMTNLFQVSEILADNVGKGVVKVVRPRIIEVEVPVAAEADGAEEEDGKKAKAEGGKTGSNESGAYFLPMMQQMMAQYQQQMQMPSMYGQPGGGSGAIPQMPPGQMPPGQAPPGQPPQGVASPGQPPQQPAPPQPVAPPQAPATPVDMGGGRALHYATSPGSPAAPAAAAPAPAAPAPASTEAERLVAEAEAALGSGDLQAALATFRKAKDADGAAQVASALSAGEDRVRQALEKDGVRLEAVPKLKCDMNELMQLEISPQEGFMLTRVDGTYDIKSILKMSPMPKLDAQILFWRLKRSGHVAV
ncbi:MAG: DUF4388 domain-containing protein [Acidobacteriota bacterium]